MGKGGEPRPVCRCRLKGHKRKDEMGEKAVRRDCSPTMAAPRSHRPGEERPRNYCSCFYCCLYFLQFFFSFVPRPPCPAAPHQTKRDPPPLNSLSDEEHSGLGNCVMYGVCIAWRSHCGCLALVATNVLIMGISSLVTEVPSFRVIKVF